MTTFKMTELKINHEAKGDPYQNKRPKRVNKFRHTNATVIVNNNQYANFDDSPEDFEELFTI